MEDTGVPERFATNTSLTGKADQLVNERPNIWDRFKAKFSPNPSAQHQSAENAQSPEKTKEVWEGLIFDDAKDLQKNVGLAAEISQQLTGIHLMDEKAVEQLDYWKQTHNNEFRLNEALSKIREYRVKNGLSLTVDSINDIANGLNNAQKDELINNLQGVDLANTEAVKRQIAAASTLDTSDIQQQVQNSIENFVILKMITDTSKKDEWENISRNNPATETSQQTFTDANQQAENASQQQAETQPVPTKDYLSEKLSMLKASSTALFDSTKGWMKDRLRKKTTREHRQKIESGEELKDFMAEIRGKLIDKAAKTNNPLPMSFGIGIAGGLMRHQALEAGMTFAEAAPWVAVGASLARDSYRAFTADTGVIAAMAARYVKEKPVSQTAPDSQTAQPKKGIKEKAISGLAKVAWWSQIVERNAVGVITRKELKEDSSSKEILEFINSKAAEITQPGDSVGKYLSDKTRIKDDVKAWLNDKKVRDKTGQLIDTFGFLTDAKTLNNYRDIKGLDHLSGNTTDETVQNLEALRGSLHDIVLTNLYSIKNLNKVKFHDYVDQLSGHKWGKLRKAKYVGAIATVGAGMAAVKAFAGVKAVDMISHFGEAVTESEAVQQAGVDLQEFGNKSKEDIVDFGEKADVTLRNTEEVVVQKTNEAADFLKNDLGKIVEGYGKDAQEYVKQLDGRYGKFVEEVEGLNKVDTGAMVREFAQTAHKSAVELGNSINEQLKDFETQMYPKINEFIEQIKNQGTSPAEAGAAEAAADAEKLTNLYMPNVATGKGSDEVAEIIEGFADAGEAAWTGGAEAGKYISENIDMGELKNSWMHGDVEVPRSGAFNNFFGHWASEGGQLSKDAALKMGEQLRDALLVDQEDFMTMSRLISEPIANAASPMSLENILNTMDKQDALKAAYYIYAEGLIKNPDSRKVVVDFIRNNTG